VLVQAGWPPDGSNGRPPVNVISPRARLASTPVWGAVVVPAVFRRSAPEFPVSMSDYNRTAAQYAETIRLSAKVPTLTLSDPRCIRSGFCTSTATLPLLARLRLCCIDLLNPHDEAATRASNRHLGRASLIGRPLRYAGRAPRPFRSFERSRLYVSNAADC
jgi:hypothetical protein